MAVYIDDARIRVRRMVMCHMVADTTQELLAMVDEIGVSRRWIQAPGTYREHFDVCISKVDSAMESGAIGVSQRYVGRLLRERRLKSQEKPDDQDH